MMFSLPSPLTSPRTDDAVCVPDVDWDGAAALVGDWLPCGLPALPTDSPFGAIRVPELPLPNPFTFDPGADCPEGELPELLPEEVGPTICTSEPPEEEFPELPPEDMPGPVAGPLELLPEETPIPIELE